ncbi:MAG: DNA mismatch repair protein MutS [Nitrospiraceae bacterium]
MITNSADSTPLMRQYREIKEAYRDAILFFRVGDFYEMFHQDAEEASRLLNIALTSRDKHSVNPVPLCGVPYHAATTYIAKLLKAGRTVALCDQVEDPKLAKGLVRREVVRLYTPGTLVDAELLAPEETAYLAALTASDEASSSHPVGFGLAAIDLSTGDFRISSFEGEEALPRLMGELSRLEPRELLIPDTLDRSLVERPGLPRGCRICPLGPEPFDLAAAESALHQQFPRTECERLHTLNSLACLRAAGAIFSYLRDTQRHGDLRHIRGLVIHQQGDEMHLDAMTIRNLELVRPLAHDRQEETDRRNTLLSVIDRTVTVMGRRLLREWVLRPSLRIDRIAERLDAVQELLQLLETRVQMRSLLRGVQDVTRLTGRLALARATPRDLSVLRQSLAVLPGLPPLLGRCQSTLLARLCAEWDDATDLHDLLNESLLPEVPLSSRDGGIVKDGCDPSVDALRNAMRDGKQWLLDLETRERTRTGIDSLKVRYNQVFGYYIEVSKPNLSRVPPDYVRKQTLVNAERFMTAELKELEERITGAEVKLKALEAELFDRLVRQLTAQIARLQNIGARLALVDTLAALAEVAALHRYGRPTVDNGSMIEIIEGRHPVVERLDLEGGFIPNDTRMDLETHRLLIITGPNMAGKSTYLRQVALIVLLAQMGSFVPASRARIGLVDRVFTRVGASDNLAAGQSTFMVEMSETAHILRHATSRSLILLDEIGRGTSTYDGLSLAWSIAEYIQSPSNVGARTLFATHYHEMTQLEDLRPGIRNYRVAVQERDGDVLFLRKIVEGGADRSYGIHVAKLAGLPLSILNRAQEVLHQLEQGASSSDRPLHHGRSRQDSSLPAPHPILSEMKQMDLFTMTPLEAMNRLADLKRRLDQG